MKFAILCLLGTLAFGQVRNGRVTGAVSLFEGGDSLSYDFSLLNSEGGTAKQSFSYNDKGFSLFLMGGGCIKGCGFSGKIISWNKPVAAGNCQIHSANVQGSFLADAYWPEVNGVYYQAKCSGDGEWRWAGGGLSLELRKGEQ